MTRVYIYIHYGSRCGSNIHTNNVKSKDSQNKFANIAFKMIISTKICYRFFHKHFKVQLHLK